MVTKINLFLAVFICVLYVQGGSWDNELASINLGDFFRC